MMLTHKIEEVLESIWTAKECGSSHIIEIGKRSKIEITKEILNELIDGALIIQTNDLIELTANGAKEAKGVIRRHRLAERLLADVLNRSGDEMEETACEFEHFLAPEITEGICILLGHPKLCPHGSPIPPGNCCIQARKSVESVIIPLDMLNAGESARVAYITTQNHPRLHKLLSFGFAPGLTIHLHQKSPTFIIESDQSQLALEADVAKDIFVWKKEKAD